MTQPAATPPTPPAAVTIPPGLEVASLAAELATKLYTVADTLLRFSITAAQLKLLMSDAQFRHMVADYRRQWNAPMSARERVKAKASLAVEDGLAELYRTYHDTDIHPQARLDAFKQLVALADMQPKQNAQDTGTKFSLHIQLADSRAETVVIESAQEDAAHVHTPVTVDNTRAGDVAQTPAAATDGN